MAFKIPMLFVSFFLFSTLPIHVVSIRNTEGSIVGKEPAFEFLKHLQGCHKGDNVTGIHQLKNYLERFGYLHYNSSKNKTSDDFDDALVSALKTYQSNYNIRVTGVLDADTVSKMVTPRCGVPDIINGTNTMDRTHHGTIHTVAHYTFFPGSPRWPASKRDLKYAFEANTPTNAISAIVRAFNRWDSVTHFTFTRVQSTRSADIVVGFFRGNHGDGAPFDGRGGVLAHAFAPTVGLCHFDADDRFSIGPVQGASDVETVALHEIGHLLGLDHSSVPNAIMFPSIPPGTTKGFDADDIQGYRALYNV